MRVRTNLVVRHFLSSSSYHSTRWDFQRHEILVHTYIQDTMNFRNPLDTSSMTAFSIQALVKDGLMIQDALSMTPFSHIEPHSPYRSPKPLTSHSRREPFNLPFVVFLTSLQNISDIIPPPQEATRTDKQLHEARDCGDFPGGPTAYDLDKHTSVLAAQR
jgi:hypothetical protein